MSSASHIAPQSEHLQFNTFFVDSSSLNIYNPNLIRRAPPANLLQGAAILAGWLLLATYAVAPPGPLWGLLEYLTTPLHPLSYRSGSTDTDVHRDTDSHL